MKFENTSQPLTNGKVLEKVGHLPQLVQSVSKDCIDRFQQCLYTKPNSEKPDSILDKKYLEQYGAGVSDFTGCRCSTNKPVDKKIDLAITKSKHQFSEPLVTKVEKQAEKAPGARFEKDTMKAKEVENVNEENISKSSESKLLPKNKKQKSEFTEFGKPTTVRPDSRDSENSSPVSETPEASQLAVDIPAQLMMARLELNPFVQQTSMNSLMPVTPQPATTGLSARITETEEIKALINKYVSQLLVESKSDLKQEPGHLMMRMGENLENMDLMISKNKYGDWQLRCTCPNQNTAHWMQRVSKSLVKRFAEKDLGVLKIEVELV